MSGHFATLLRGTLETLLQDHDVYITDWQNARDMPVSAGSSASMNMSSTSSNSSSLWGRAAMSIGVCQPTVAVLAAVALMSEDNNPATPRSMTLMAGPIDTRRNPTKVNKLAKTKEISWFEEKMIGVVPWRYKGAGRRVYPGFVQLSAFVSMNLDKHIGAHIKQFRSLAAEDTLAASTHRAFYDEYLSVMDLPAEFYLETVSAHFHGSSTGQGRIDL